MRQFVVVGHDAPTDAEFSLDDLPGGAGRFDVLCRCVNSAFFLSHDIREDVRVWLVLRDEVALRLEGSELRYMNPDERNVASLLRKALEKRDELVGHAEVESTPGIYASARGFEPVLDAAAREGAVVQLHEDGDPVVDVDPPENPVFVLSDHRDFTDAEAALLADVAAERVRLGPALLHADHAVTVAHNYLDTEGFATY